jgi:hypothetical protein
VCGIGCIGRGNVQQLFVGVATSPYLILRVHRDNLIAETLQEISYKVDELQKPLKARD